LKPEYNDAIGNCPDTCSMALAEPACAQGVVTATVHVNAIGVHKKRPILMRLDSLGGARRLHVS
jgi:hypothetical protein